MSKHSLAEHVRSLAAYMPGGKMFAAKNILGSSFNQLLRGLAGEFRTTEDYLNTFEAEYFPDSTTLYLDEWERALGIPDACFDGVGTADERRESVLVKLAALGVQTAQDFVDLALRFGKVVTVLPLSGEALPPYAVPFTPVELPAARFILVVEGPDISTATPPYSVPFNLAGGESRMECVFRTLTPANCDLIFRNSN